MPKFATIKKKKTELNVDHIGGQGSLTPEEENGINLYLRSKLNTKTGRNLNDQDLPSKSLSDIEGKWSNEIPQEEISSSIQLRTYALYHKALENFTLDDIRFMIGQHYGLAILIPKAIEYLKGNILIEACHYEGDLLQSVIITPDPYWKTNEIVQKSLCKIISNQRKKIEQLDLRFEADRKLAQDCNAFINKYCSNTNP